MPETPTTADQGSGGGAEPRVLARTGGDGSLLLPIVLGGVSLAGLASAWRSRRLV